ncbi:MAG: hypothetical protein ABIE22_00025 [archaeon]
MQEIAAIELEKGIYYDECKAFESGKSINYYARPIQRQLSLVQRVANEYLPHFILS